MNAGLLWNMLQRAILWVKFSPFMLWRRMLMIAVDYEAWKTTNGFMKSHEAVSHSAWLVGNNSVGWSEYPYNHFGKQGNHFCGVVGRGEKISPLFRGKPISGRGFLPTARRNNLCDGRWTPNYLCHSCREEKKFLLMHESTSCHSKDGMMKSKVMGKTVFGEKIPPV